MATKYPAQCVMCRPNTKFVQKLAFAYRNCPLSLEATKHFASMHTSTVSCDPVLKIFLNVLFMT